MIHFGRYAFPDYDKQRIRKLGTMDAMDIMGIHTHSLHTTTPNPQLYLAR